MAEGQLNWKNAPRVPAWLLEAESGGLLEPIDTCDNRARDRGNRLEATDG